MGEETKVEKMFMTTEDGRGIVWEGIKDIQFTDSEDDDIVVPRELLTDREISFTAEVKWPKFQRCKNRKRCKKLMMSLGYSRDLVEVYFGLIKWLRYNIEEYNPSYQELWNEVRINTLGF